MKATAAIVFLIGLGFAFNTASCASKNSCAGSAGAGGSSGSAGSGGSGGSSDCSTSTNAGSAGAATTCSYLTALHTCFTAFCKADGAGTPFCTCYGRGYNLDAPPGCSCIPIKSSAVCQQAEDRGIDGSSVDCAIETSAIATQCVGVQ